MKSFVTGCAGFVGSHLVERLLKDGHEVTGIDFFTNYYSRDIKEKNMEKFIDNENFNFVEDDIENADLKSIIKKTDFVFHQAAQAGVRASWGDMFSIYIKCNILATQKLLEASKSTNIKKLIYASSSSIYGDVEELPINEETKPKPISPYGVTKLAGEHLCYLYWKNYSVPTVSLRYFTVYGPRQRPDMGFHKFIASILEGKEITIYGDGNQTRDFTFIEDIIEANILSSKKGTNGSVYNIGGGSRTSINNIIKIVEKITNKSAILKYEDKQKGDVKDTYADISKAKKIDYSPKTNLEKGLNDQIKYIKNKLF